MSRRAGRGALVAGRQAGKHRIYQVDPDRLAVLRAELDRFWNKTLTAYKTVVEQPAEEMLMSTQAATTSVRASIVVEAPIERAFDVFTADFGRFKPAEHNLLGSEIAETVFEPRVGGYLYDRGADGSECRWARVLAYEPPISRGGSGGRGSALGWPLTAGSRRAWLGRLACPWPAARAR